MGRKIYSITFAMLGWIACAQNACADYTVTMLGTLFQNQGESRAYSINDAGEVVGNTSYFGSTNAFLYSNGVMSRIGDGNAMSATGINNNGDIVGISSNRSFLYEDASLTDLGTTTNFYVRAINNNGLMVGSSGSSDAQRAVYYDNATNQPVWLDNRFAGALAVNDIGQAVGFRTNNSGRQVAALFDNNSVFELNSLSQFGSQAYDINNKGQIVGWSFTTSGLQHAFVYDLDTNQMVDLGTLGGRDGFAYAINDDGLIVGTSKNSSGTDRAFIYDNGHMIDLNTLLSNEIAGFVLTEARGINSQGQIVGWGTYQGVNRAFLLTPNEVPPIDPPGNPVPAPAGLLLGLLGATGFGLYQRGWRGKVASE